MKEVCWFFRVSQSERQNKENPSGLSLRSSVIPTYLPIESEGSFYNRLPTQKGAIQTFHRRELIVSIFCVCSLPVLFLKTENIFKIDMEIPLFSRITTMLSTESMQCRIPIPFSHSAHFSSTALKPTSQKTPKYR